MFQPAATGDLTAPDEVGDKTNLPCPVCGDRSYSWGSLRAQGVHFTPDDAFILAKFFGFGFKMRARCCDRCGNVQMFARPPKADRG